MASDGSGQKNQVEKFEDAFQSVCKYLEKLDEKKTSSEDLKKDTDILVNTFLDAGRACEQFFLQKHLQICNAKPEQILREECNELKQEISKKDQALTRHHEKLKMWQQSLKPTGAHPAATRVSGQPNLAQMPGGRMHNVPPAYALQGQSIAPSSNLPM